MMAKRTLGVFLIGLGLVGAVITALPKLSFVRKAVPVSGQIKSLEARFGEKKNYIADVKYTFDGKEYHSEFRLRRNRYSVGQWVPLLVESEKPEHAEIDDLLRLYMLPTVFLCFGILGLVVIFHKKTQ